MAGPYNIAVTTPPNTLATDPMITQIKLQNGLFTRFECYIPTGSEGLLGVAVFESNVQLYPANRGAWFIGDGVLFGYDVLHNFVTENQTLTIKTYNTDADLNHECFIIINLLTDPLEIDSVLIAKPLSALVAAIDELSNIMNQSVQAQTTKARKILGTQQKVGA